MTREQEIKAREKAATKGPWEAERLGKECYVNGPKVLPIPDTVAFTWPDANFMAHAREDIPYLLACLRDSEARLEAAREYASEMNRDDCVIELLRILNGGD